MSSGFSRGLTQVLYQYVPEAIFSHDDYGLCKVTHVTLEDQAINREALFSALQDLLGRWKDGALRAAFPDPASSRERDLFRIGTPREVHFRPFPQILKCGKCNRAYRYEDVRRTAGGRCPECHGRLGQLPYVLVHNCGRLEQLFYPEKGCSAHGRRYLRFYDPGRAQQARWQCGICGQEIQRLRMTPCRCEFSKRTDEKRGTFLRIYYATAPGVYFSHTITFVNFDENQEKALRSNPEAFALLVARAWDLLGEPVRDAARRTLGPTEGTRGSESTLVALIEELKRLDPDNELLEQLRKQQVPAHAESTAKVRNLLGDLASVLDCAPPRKLLEHVCILDELRTSEPETVARQHTEQGRDDAAELREAMELAEHKLGFRRLYLIDDFPIAVSAIGYSRVSRRPDTTSILPFPGDSSGRIPLYVVPSDTEGIMFQLSPARVLRWLVLNGALEGPVPSNTTEAWAFLFRRIPSLLLGEDTGKGDPTDPARLIYTLLHSISHVLLRGVEWSGFSSPSVGEYLLPGTLSAVLYLSRYEETKLGGLATLFEEHLLPWLTQALQEGRECTYDPVCTDEGGSCSGCLHREHNCPDFNEWLSRSVLYGGTLDPTPASSTNYITAGYWDMPEEGDM